jgi:hypothetical protein
MAGSTSSSRRAALADVSLFLSSGQTVRKSVMSGAGVPEDFAAGGRVGVVLFFSQAPKTPEIVAIIRK